MTLDDFRAQTTFNPLEDEENEPAPDKQERSERPHKPFLGMTPAQRFLVAALLLFITCVLGTFILMMMERVVIPTGLF